MHLNDRKSDRTHLNPLLTQISILIANLKSEFHKNLKKNKNLKNQKTRFFFRLFRPELCKIFSEFWHHRIIQKKMV